ncbi:hypothetical protein EWU23_11750 [Cytophagaceae bacterium 50C-KIRBA]|uniref:Uncharacterized protein n=1 Tax=Aquirufa beregesia TaxID=2516556 RepID=A0ABX0F299_9BACT|nr:hypothetical protein [Aquirufa beregesia]
MENKAYTPNSTYPKGGVSCSKNYFVVNQTLVFQIKFCGKYPAPRVAAKSYESCLGTLLPRTFYMKQADKIKHQ